MCGIAGVLSSLPLTSVEFERVECMNDFLVHRGPDSQGVLFDTHLALAMRRLSIIDLAGGQQPLFNETGRIALVCNGEIYNYLELREELVRNGHHFSSQSDSETIVHLYEERGLDFIESLRGMFALALWDSRRHRLILARDRMGEKPLYYCWDRLGRLWFASEMKSLLAHSFSHSPKLSPEAVNLFLTYQYVPEPLTLLEGVFKLPAGHYLDLNLEKLKAQPTPYWDYLAIKPREGDPVTLVREELERACQIMGQADVPVGVALSGGIDSTVVAALSARSYPGTLQAFSVGYPGRPENDERSAAAGFARHLGIPYFEVELATDEFVENFPKLVWAMDDPIGDIAAYGYYAVSALARRHGVPVLLSGLGGDELFWGYSWVRDAVRRTKRKNRIRNLPVWLKGLVMPTGLNAPNRMVFYDMHDGIRQGDKWSRAILTSLAKQTLAPDLWMRYFEFSDWEPIALRLSHTLNQTWLLSNCLALADRMSMAHSIEMRLPLLDIGLVELVTGLRRNGLADWEKPHKWLLIEAVKDLVPENIFSRRKQGFVPPVLEWYGAIRQRYASLLSGGILVQQNIVNEEVVERYLAEITPDFAFKLILLEVWCRLFFNGEEAEELAQLGSFAKQRKRSADTT